MPDDPEKPFPAAQPATGGAHAPGGGQAGGSAGSATPPPSESMPPGGEESSRDRDRGISDMFRRAVAVGLEAAGRSKDDFVRIASTEVRGWLDHLELDTELRKALSKMVLEVKAEIRFRPAEDGTLVSETETEMRVRPPGKNDRQP
jgi:hypothetical protein